MTPEIIVNHLWQSSCFALLASVLAFLLRGNSPKVRYWVWLSASLKFLVPWVLLVSLGSAVPWPSYRVTSVAPPTLPDTLIQIAEPFSPNLYTTIPARSQSHWGATVLAFLWAAGLIMITFTRCRSWLRVRAMLRAGSPVELPIAVPTIITSSAHEPGIVGFLRPVLVLPTLLLERLNPRQLEALLAHELSHIRRRDNFFAALHMGVEAIFWFHPVVWWIGSRMLEERELACDEEVLQLGCEPTDYARGILTVCEHYSEARLPCVSGVTGADIKKRLNGILRGTSPRELNRFKKLALALVAIVAIAVPVALGVWVAPTARAQSEIPKFAVAAIKQEAAYAGLHNPDCSGDRFTVAGLHFTYVLQWAYDVQGTTAGTAFLQRVPLSIRRETYDIQAKADRPFASESQCRLMVQALLADRFKLAFHYEQRDVDLFDLVVGSGGPKLRQALPTDSGTDINFVINGFTHTEPPIENDDARAHTKGVTMQEFAQWLPTPEPVTDKTGLEGRYKIDLRVSTLLPADGQDPVDPPLDAALGKLGLRLEKHKGSVKVPVLDHIEPPDAN